jgi:hypothetical protein
VHVVRAGPTKATTLEAFAEELDLPAWSGANLDALADGLGYVARTADHDREVVLDGVPTLVSRHGGRALTMDS